MFGLKDPAIYIRAQTQQWKDRLTSVPQPLLHSTLAEKPPPPRGNETPAKIHCKQQRREPTPCSDNESRPSLPAGIYSGNHLQVPTTPQVIRPPKLPEKNQDEGWRRKKHVVVLSWHFAMSVAFLIQIFFELFWNLIGFADLSVPGPGLPPRHCF